MQSINWPGFAMLVGFVNVWPKAN